MPGIQMRRNLWQDGILGTNCPIPPKWNWTYQFQVKDQIGSFLGIFGAKESKRRRNNQWIFHIFLCFQV
ncbi:unnamed protein product [Trifolium pratense]|uniref:Uncharacterized protein n=1 Tax=Trifolium pratense TaxID=57577 RepID=A0ACB0IJD8_TRIPR|nr:unnamed protein product [Trifolium pratense]